MKKYLLAIMLVCVCPLISMLLSYLIVLFVINVSGMWGPELANEAEVLKVALVTSGIFGMTGGIFLGGYSLRFD